MFLGSWQAPGSNLSESHHGLSVLRRGMSRNLICITGTSLKMSEAKAGQAVCPKLNILMTWCHMDTITTGF